MKHCNLNLKLTMEFDLETVEQNWPQHFIGDKIKCQNLYVQIIVEIMHWNGTGRAAFVV